MQTFQMDLEQFNAYGARIIGISPDTLEKHEEFSEKYGITFPLVSDVDGSVKGLYGRGRTTYLIDRQGIVRFIHAGVPDNKELLNNLKRIESGKD